jgi:uncharacterized protein YecE (DUF72 family)
MGRVYAGTSGWAYATWKPDFYPAKLASAKFLSFYANKLNSVEVNYTFRRFPTEKLLRGWIETVPEAFKFAIKANQEITHVKRLRDVGQFTSEFIAALQPLGEGDRLGPILFQLPPFLKCDLPLLQDFVAELPKHLRTAFEFRHESWFSDAVFDILRKGNVALCQAESEKLETPEICTADFCYMRFRKEEYSPKTRKELAARVATAAKNGDVFVYFKHEETPEGVLYAQSLLQQA